MFIFVFCFLIIVILFISRILLVQISHYSCSRRRFFLRSSNPQDIQSERETPAAKQKANEIFRQKQYQQHHHVIHAPTASATSEERGTKNGPSSVTASYLNSLHRFSSNLDDDGTISGTSSHGQILVENEGEKYLDSLSLARYPKSTWSHYKDTYLNKQSVKIDNESNDSDHEVNGESMYLTRLLGSVTLYCTCFVSNHVKAEFKSHDNTSNYLQY